MTAWESGPKRAVGKGHVVIGLSTLNVLGDDSCDTWIIGELTIRRRFDGLID